MIDTALAFLGPVGWPEIVIILAIALLLFGGKKLPELARGLGRGLRHFKEEVQGIKSDIGEAIDEDVSVPEDTPKDTPEDIPEDTSEETASAEEEQAAEKGSDDKK